MQRLVNQRAKLFLVIFIMEGNHPAYAKKTGSDLQLIANHPVFQFETEFFSNSFCAYKANIKKELRFLGSFLDCDFTKYRHKTFATNELSNEMKEILWQAAENSEIVIEKWKLCLTMFMS